MGLLICFQSKAADRGDKANTFLATYIQVGCRALTCGGACSVVVAFMKPCCIECSLWGASTCYLDAHCVYMAWHVLHDYSLSMARQTRAVLQSSIGEMSSHASVVLEHIHVHRNFCVFIACMSDCTAQMSARRRTKKKLKRGKVC